MDKWTSHKHKPKRYTIAVSTQTIFFFCSPKSKYITFFTIINCEVLEKV